MESIARKKVVLGARKEPGKRRTVGEARRTKTNRFIFAGDSERQIEIHEELVANFEEGFPRPFQEPIDGRAVDQGRVLA